jgi:signal transduction histidine kinase
LLRAAEQVLEAHALDGGPGLGPLLRALTERVSACATDPTHHLEPDPAIGSRLALDLLAELRLELFRQWSGGKDVPAAEDVLATWGAFDAVRAEIAKRERQSGPAIPGREFTEQLSGPKGLELVVEVAHDLRSPLTSILFLAETLQRGQSGRVNDLQHRQLGLIYSAALGLSTLASNVMELARGGTRLADDQPAPFSVTDVLESVGDIVRPMAEEKGLAVRLLPPVPDHRLGPAQALSRVLLNLTTNAIKFTEEGVVEIVAKARDGSVVEFSVRDTGRGINPDTVETLFLPFRPGPEGARMAFSGTGLGLALCRKLVRAMGSELAYETSPDWGTRFYFELDLPPAGT